MGQRTTFPEKEQLHKFFPSVFTRSLPQLNINCNHIEKFTTSNQTIYYYDKMDKTQLNQAVNNIQQENFDLKINLLSLINDYNNLKQLVMTSNCHKRCFLEVEQSKINDKMLDYIDFESEDEYMLSRTTSPGSDSLMETLTRLNTELSDTKGLVGLPGYSEKEYEFKFENFVELDEPEVINPKGLSLG